MKAFAEEKRVSERGGLAVEGFLEGARRDAMCDDLS